MMDLRTEDFDYHLPQDLIAQEPPAVRGDSRLLVLHRDVERIEHRWFRDLPEYLRRGDVLVANRSRVLPARLQARKESGGSVEILLLRRWGKHRWSALARPSRKLHEGTRLLFDESPLHCVVTERRPDGEWVFEFGGVDDTWSEMRRLGSVPLPHYIHHPLDDSERYQTVYADRDGSVAAPTAGLHFSSDMLDALRGRGVEDLYVTLHVGAGTFRPVTAQRVTDHQMHAEWGEVPSDVARAINGARAAGGRCVAVGTTSVRVLETACANGEVTEFEGDTDVFLYPGHRFCAVDALITNFHLPKSTLLMLVSALAGRDFILRAYREAVERRYRFFSFGDAMLIV